MSNSLAAPAPAARPAPVRWVRRRDHRRPGAPGGAAVPLPRAALSVPAATLAGESGVLVAGLLVAPAVAAGLTLSAKRS
ncbi:hypothetical protein [Kitasatospora phosalacinea]|uniref:Uncharacterized protein n=1 Tax=Kitasatospora phosalacinea TaxID=2065 RepID=A0A9W6PH41_9ACTN|nr:hypothetical protein [Kitasatospora phosalacinea]GLW54996.1 hypothetical protein Kpho01_30070 [Kitasatospora phosalacinea]